MFSDIEYKVRYFSRGYWAFIISPAWRDVILQYPFARDN